MPSPIQITTKFSLVALLSFAVGAGGAWKVMTYRMDRAEKSIEAQSSQIEALRSTVAANNDTLRNFITANNEATRSAIAAQNETLGRVAGILEGMNDRLKNIETRR